jgi:dihydrofolate reductase
MARLILWNLMTLDGYVAGPGGNIDWHMDVWGPELEALSNAQGKEAGALMFGRITYDLMAGYWPNETGTTADFMNALPKFVFSRTLKESPWRNTTMFNADAPETVTRLKRDTAKDIYLFGSSDLAGSLIPHGLIDEFRICVVPCLIGGGIPLFKPGAQQKLDLTDTQTLPNGGVILRYRPAA